MAKRKKTTSKARRPKKSFDDPPVLALSKSSAQSLAELAERERRDHSAILNDAIKAYAASKKQPSK